MKRTFRGSLGLLDWPLLTTVAVILVLGLMNLYSATYNLSLAKYFKYQIVYAGIGTAVALGLVFLNYRQLERFAYAIYGLLLTLLVLVLVLGKTSQGSQRWLVLFGLHVQPSELAKIGVAIILAKTFHERKSLQTMGLAELIKPCFLALLPFFLILKQPDLGTSLVIVGMSLCVLLLVGIKKRILLFGLVLVLVSMPIAWKYGLKPYQKDRVIGFINPEKYSLGIGYQLIQSKIAIGSGQATGRGYLKGTQSKLQFLPKQYTDFVYSNFAEEFGFLGSLFLIGLYLLLGLLGFRIAATARDIFGMVLAFGLTCIIMFQAVVNLGMEMGSLPVVGMTLPLFSYGGTSLMTTMISVGLLLSIGSRRYLFGGERP